MRGTITPASPIIVKAPISEMFGSFLAVVVVVKVSGRRRVDLNVERFVKTPVERIVVEIVE